MSDYFNATGTIGFTCDNCGRELQGCTWVNGMRVCAKCYQETFGASKDWQLLDKDKTIAEQRKQIADLEAKLAEKDKELRVKIGNMKTNDFIKMCLQCGFMVDAKEKDNQEKISFAVEQLEKALKVVETVILTPACIDIIKKQIKQLKEMK